MTLEFLLILRVFTNLRLLNFTLPFTPSEKWTKIVSMIAWHCLWGKYLVDPVSLVECISIKILFFLLQTSIATWNSISAWMLDFSIRIFGQNNLYAGCLKFRVKREILFYFGWSKTCRSIFYGFGCCIKISENSHQLILFKNEKSKRQIRNATLNFSPELKYIFFHNLQLKSSIHDDHKMYSRKDRRHETRKHNKKSHNNNNLRINPANYSGGKW